MRISEALSMYLLQLDADGRSLHTRRQYARHIGLLARSVGDCDLSELTHQRIAAFLVSDAATKSADGAPKRAVTLNALRSSLRTAFGWWHAAGVIPTNPARLVRLARCGAPPPRSLSEEEQRRLLEVLARAKGWQAERDHALFHLMLATGIRLGSALALDVEDVDLERGEILLRTTKGNAPGKVFLGSAIRERLSICIGARSEGSLFQSRHGRPLSARQAQRRFATWLERAGVTRGASPHVLRHCFGMRMYRATGDLLLVQRALGHRSISSTIVYARCDDMRLRRALS